MKRMLILVVVLLLMPTMASAEVEMSIRTIGGKDVAIAIMPAKGDANFLAMSRAVGEKTAYFATRFHGKKIRWSFEGLIIGKSKIRSLQMSENLKTGETHAWYVFRVGQRQFLVREDDLNAAVDKIREYALRMDVESFWEHLNPAQKRALVNAIERSQPPSPRDISPPQSTSQIGPNTKPPYDPYGNPYPVSGRNEMLGNPYGNSPPSQTPTQIGPSELGPTESDSTSSFYNQSSLPSTAFLDAYGNPVDPPMPIHRQPWKPWNRVKRWFNDLRHHR